MNNICFNHQVLINKFGGISIIGVYATHPGRGQNALIFAAQSQPEMVKLQLDARLNPDSQ